MKATAILLSTVVINAYAAVTFQYFYDDRGQLARVVDSSGVVIQYVYDGVGNIIEVQRSTVAPGALSIFSFTPLQTGPGTTLTIQGQGFSSTSSANIVRINGVQATVLTATTSTLTVVVPTGASSGPVSVTVGSATATSPSSFTFLSVPAITSISRRFVLAGDSVSGVTVNGFNFAGAAFAFLPAISPTAVTVASANISPAGTSATLALAVHPTAAGTFTLVGTNTGGLSDPFPTAGNTLLVLRPGVDEDKDGLTNTQEIAAGTDPLNPDTDGDAYPDGVEVGAGSNPLNAASTPETAFPLREANGALFSALNTAAPDDPTAAFREVNSFLISVLNTASPVDPTAEFHETVGPLISVLNIPVGEPILEVVSPLISVQNSPPPTMSDNRQRIELRDPRQPPLRIEGIDGSRAPSALYYEGESVRFRVDASNVIDLVGVELSVNGVKIAEELQQPYEFLFTVPAGIPAIALRMSAVDKSGQRIPAELIVLNVVSPPVREIAGVAIDESGKPIAGAEVAPSIQGLVVEYFDFKEPLLTLPDLERRAPDRTAIVTALNLRNPASVFGGDPFNLKMGPDYAARYKGKLRISQKGRYTFFLGADEGAVLKIDGQTVIAMPVGRGEYQEQYAQVQLEPGLASVEVTHYESIGTTELQLSFAPPDGKRQVIGPEYFENNLSGVAPTDGSGQFRFVVPAHVPLAGVDVRTKELRGAVALVPNDRASAFSVLMKRISPEGR